jgi:ATP-dependent exoDNAse (exonuclease V) alpha subunit
VLKKGMKSCAELAERSLQSTAGGFTMKETSIYRLYKNFSNVSKNIASTQSMGLQDSAIIAIT